MNPSADVAPHRARLFGVAYRMLGSRADAEDAVQEAFLRWHRHGGDVREPLAWLVTVVTRISLDLLRALRAERAAYEGPWLPDPLVDVAADDPARRAELADDLSVGFVLALERLAPEERAAYLLHEAFDYRHAEIARILERSEPAVRQLVHRARERLRHERPRFAIDRDAAAAVVGRLLDALERGDAEALHAVLAADVTHTADGGPMAGAARNVVRGGERVTRLLLGLRAKQWRGAQLRRLDVNGAPGFGLYDDTGALRGTVAIASDGARVRALYVVINPAKLPAAPG